jgi:diguanylate cyclase (GGDEF)-like protein/PAS domain S-box-containing protein
MQDRYEYIVNRSADFITLINRDYIYEIANDAYCDNVGLTREQVLGRTVAEIWGGDRFGGKLKAYLDRCFGGETINNVERFSFGPEQRYMHVTYYPYQASGAVTHVLVFSHDITVLGELESRLNEYEYRDPTTGLYNRRSLDLILQSEMERAKRSPDTPSLAVLFIGIENLPYINRMFGHGVGGVLLENTGLRIKETLRSTDFVFRYDGHELVVVLSHLTDAQDVARVARKLLDTITTPYRHRDNDIRMDGRIGAAVCPDDGQEPSTLVANAVAALSHAVRDGSRFVMFDSQMHARSLRRLEMETELRRAFEQDQFVLHFQPIVNRSGVIEGSEALIRWRTPTRGLLAPGEFLPVATESGLIDLIGRWALFTAARLLADWTRRFPIYLSVNLTAREFESDDLLEVIGKALAQAPGLTPSALKLEITETECMQNPTKAISRIEAIGALGVEVVVDDFGTGQSSLAYLKTLPVGVFKIDQAFSRDGLTDPEDLHFLSVVVDLVKSRRRRVIVEGVGSAQQYEALQGTRCDGFQGYYFSPPVPADAFVRLLERGGTLPV